MNKMWTVLVLFSAFARCPETVDGKAQLLKSHQWNDRIVLIVAGANMEQAEKQRQKFIDASSKSEDRKIVVYFIKGDEVVYENFGRESEPVAATAKQFNAEYGSEFKVFLIGLDGGIKMTFAEQIDPQVIFNEIDTMPMRKSEMRSDNGK